jgi:hypothetical protein
MQNKAKTVEQYLAELPEDRRAAIQTLRDVIRKNLDADYEEGMSYGMIGYCVPHRIYPAGYHCDPKQALPFVSLASQKNHLAVYMMHIYFSPEFEAWFRKSWAASGRKLDMGKSCIRFRKIEDADLATIGEAIRRMPAGKFIEFYERMKPAPKASKQTGSGKPASSGTAAKRSSGGAKSKPAGTKKPAAAKKSPAVMKKAATKSGSSARKKSR